MRVVLVSGSNVGTKTRIVTGYLQHALKTFDPNLDVRVLDLAQMDMVFADGRAYTDYPGDTGIIVREVMAADALIIGTPIFQASIPAALKNVFDLLPANAFRDKVVAIFATAGSVKHYLVPAQQLQPIVSYMKAHIVQPYVFIEAADFHEGEVQSQDIMRRLDRLVEDTVVLARTFEKIRQENGHKAKP